MFLFAFNGLYSQQETGASQKYALLFTRMPVETGVEKIIARNDLLVIIKALTRQGFPEKNILFDSTQSTREGFYKQFQKLEHSVRPGDFALVYFDIPMEKDALVNNEVKLVFDPKKPHESISLKAYGELQQGIAMKIKYPELFMTLFDAERPSGDYSFPESLKSDYLFAGVPNELNLVLNLTSVFATSVASAMGSVTPFNTSKYGFFENIRKQVLLLTTLQNPVWITNHKKGQLFNGLTRLYSSHFTISEKKDPLTIVMNAGNSINITAGARVKIYPAFQDTTSLSALTEGVVESTTAFSSTIKLEKPLNGSLEDAWAYVVKNGKNPSMYRIKFNQSFEGDANNRTLFNEIIGHLKKSEIASHIEWLASGGDIQIKNIRQVPGEATQLTLVNPITGMVQAELLLVEKLGNIAALENYIKKLAAFEYLSNLKNNIPELAVSFKFQYVEPGKKLLKENGYDVYFEGDKVFMTFYNPNPYPVYFALLDLQPDRVINRILPNSDLYLESDGTPYLPEKCVIGAFDSLSLKNMELEFSAPFGSERIKLITSLRPIDIESFFEGSSRRAAYNNDLSKLVQTYSTTDVVPIFNDFNIQHYDFEIRNKLYATTEKKEEKVTTALTRISDGKKPTFTINNPSKAKIYFNLLTQNADGGFTLIFPASSIPDANYSADSAGKSEWIMNVPLKENATLITVYSDRPFNLKNFINNTRGLNDILLDIFRNNRVSGSPLNNIGWMQDLYNPITSTAARDADNVSISLVTPKIAEERGGITTAMEPKFDINGFASCSNNKAVKTVRINGSPVSYNTDRKFFDTSVSLSPGNNKIVIEALDEKGFTATRIFMITLKNDNSVSSSRESKNFFLGIAIDDYEVWPKLNNAKNDVKAFAALIEEKFGFDSLNVKFLLDKAATRSKIINSIRDFLKKTGPNDNVIVYLSGHGNEDQLKEGGYFFIPQEADADDVSMRVSASEIMDNFKLIGANKCLLIVDACYSGMITNDVKTTTKTLTSSGNKLLPDDEGCKWVITSGRATKVSDGEKGTNSPFATVLLNYLKEHDDESSLRLPRIVDFLAEKVPELYKNQEPMGIPIEGRGVKFFRVSKPGK